ncbi:hypothetical protein RRG08_033845 [Elysia crispata]|uniref:Uncharacterized protein n=1 Tax=Elysia crispata TaxID=231223 RepID=A0AAE1ED62_9GAST|nr:hypothetical protein RRG08_033845 [Elysia crispata]
MLGGGRHCLLRKASDDGCHQASRLCLQTTANDLREELRRCGRYGFPHLSSDSANNNHNTRLFKSLVIGEQTLWPKNVVSYSQDLVAQLFAWTRQE